MPEVFPNAPIVEAIFDFQVSFEEHLDFASLQAFAESLKGEFGDQATTKQLSAGIRMDDDRPTGINVETSDQGLVLKDETGGRVIQVRMDGFSFSKLKPYTQWEDVCSEALRHWESYKAKVQPAKVNRLALRYINRIDIPIPFGDFKDYILTNPEVAPGIPQAVSNFFFKVTIPDLESGAWAHIICTLAQQDDEKFVPYILDIDVFFAKEYDVNSENIKDDLETLRAFKNLIFNNSVTEKARELFR